MMSKKDEQNSLIALADTSLTRYDAELSKSKTAEWSKNELKTSSIAIRKRTNSITNHPKLSLISNAAHQSPSAARLPVNLSLSVNILLFAAKLFVFIDSLSLSVLASLVDSAMDLLSQIVIYWTERNMTRQHPKYPAGRTRLEPVGIITLSTLMIMSSIMIINEGIQGLLNNHKISNFGVIEITSMGSVIVLKFMLWIFCRSYKGIPIALALAEDHLNDVLSNCVALTAAITSYYISSVYYLDAVGSIIISLYIIYSWFGIGREEMHKIIGIEADPETIDEIKEICHEYELCNDDKYERQFFINLDTLRVYHIGRNVLVEVEIVMPQDTKLKLSHDKCLALQQDIEKLSYVERAFVHVDYQHRDKNEHKHPTLI